jgi:dienelactone hydrolase
MNHQLDEELTTQVRIPIGHVVLEGELVAPPTGAGIIVFADGSHVSTAGSGNRAIARALARAGFATLVVDMLTRDEEAAVRNGPPQVALQLLAERCVGVIEWVERHDRTATMPVGLFGANVGGTVVLIAAARVRNVSAVVSGGGRPDLADDELDDIACPTLLFAGDADGDVLDLHRRALERMSAERKFHLVAGTTTELVEAAVLAAIADAATGWYRKHLIGARARNEPHELWDG